MWFSLALMPASVVPSLLGMSGEFYGMGALCISFYMLYAGYKFVSRWDLRSARGLLHASLVYLPVVLLLAVVDSTL
jgi:protoheme IX farnesyltransferase